MLCVMKIKLQVDMHLCGKIVSGKWLLFVIKALNSAAKIKKIELRSNIDMGFCLKQIIGLKLNSFILPLYCSIQIN